MGVAGVQAEAEAEVADLLPQPRQRVQPPGHGVVATRGVLQQQRQRRLVLLQRLAPAQEALLGVVVGGDVAAVDDHRHRPEGLGRLAGVRQDLARGNADAVVPRGQVDGVGRVHVLGHRGGRELGGTRARRRDLPALRVADEELHAVGATLGGLVDGCLAVQMDADRRHAVDFNSRTRASHSDASACFML